MWTRLSIARSCLTSATGVGSAHVLGRLAGTHLGARTIGTQTPLFLKKRAAVQRGVEFMSRSLAKEDGAIAAALVTKALVAATAGHSVECHTLAWEIRDLPRTPSVGDALKATMPADASEDSAEHTLLQAAAARGLIDTVRLLLEELPVQVSRKDSKGRTAMHLAAEGNHAEVAQLLLAQGRAPPDTRDAQGRTPLMIAAESGHARTARVLMRFGANSEAEDRDGRTAISLAKNQSGGSIRGMELSPWLEQFSAKRKRTTEYVGKIAYFRGKGLDASLPAHIVAPELSLTPVGYCPKDADGKVVQLARGIRTNKKRAGPTSPSNTPNWYAIRF